VDGALGRRAVLTRSAFGAKRTRCARLEAFRFWTLRRHRSMSALWSLLGAQRTCRRDRRNDANGPIPDLTCEPLNPDIPRFFVGEPPHIRRKLDVVGSRSIILVQPGRGARSH